MAILKTVNLTKKFGGMTAVDNCSFELEEKTILGLVGPNGSGKTTLLNVINGIYEADSGDIYFKNQRITGLPAYKIAHKGIGRTFQTLRIFPKMTVLQNMLVPRKELLEKTSRLVEKAIGLLEFVNIIKLKDEYAMNLSVGQQRLLEFARTLMLNPELLLLDEPTAGIHPLMVKEMMGYIRELQANGKTFIVVGHNIPVIMDLCERVIVLNLGKTIADGTPGIIANDERVIDAYLGA